MFKDDSIISSIPTYFENKESPIVCYKYNTSFRKTIYNFVKHFLNSISIRFGRLCSNVSDQQ